VQPQQSAEGTCLQIQVSRREQTLTRLAATVAQIVIERQPGELGQLKPNGAASLALADRSATDGVAVGATHRHARPRDSSPQLAAVDGEIEQKPNRGSVIPVAVSRGWTPRGRAAAVAWDR